MDTKGLLYSIINEIGREKIQVEVNSNLLSSKQYIDKIISKCLSQLEHDERDESVISLAEALLHFMLTISTIPSQRKVQLDNGQSIDIIVPNIRTLRENPSRCVIIQMLTDLNISARIPYSNEYKVKPENVWFISTQKLPPQFKNYSVAGKNVTNDFSNILIDIDNFLSETGDKSFKLLHF